MAHTKLVNRWSVDYETIKSQIIRFISLHVPPSGVVVGVSGGIDSALVLNLCVEALGHEKVTALQMPENVTKIKAATTRYLRQLHVETEIIPIKPILDAYLKHGGIKNDPLVKGNLKARIRMCLLYSRSNADDLVVMGTGNRSELLAGYFTRYGDGGVDYLPIGELYKTQVWGLATYMGVPEEIVTQAPSADLWPGQTDEQELGISYEKLDTILFESTEKKISFNQMSIPGITKTEIEHVKILVENNRFKSTVSPICHLKK